MYSIGQLAKAFGLSRSTLLYYDEKGLLKPSFRDNANYRRYSDRDYQRLQQIMMYRNAGLSLRDIAQLVNGKSTHQSTIILESQLAQLNSDIARLRKQQKTIVNLLGKSALSRLTRTMNKQQWVDLLTAIGLGEKEMQQWHIQFERMMPEAHQDFLESINIDNEEVNEIRSWSQQALQAEQPKQTIMDVT